MSIPRRFVLSGHPGLERATDVRGRRELKHARFAGPALGSRLTPVKTPVVPQDDIAFAQVQLPCTPSQEVTWVLWYSVHFAKLADGEVQLGVKPVEVPETPRHNFELGAVRGDSNDHKYLQRWVGVDNRSMVNAFSRWVKRRGR